MNERHSGFPGLALGGYVAGVLAAGSTHVGALEFRLHRAVRIGDEFELRPDGAASSRKTGACLEGGRACQW